MTCVEARRGPAARRMPGIAWAVLLVLLCINAKLVQFYAFELNSFDTTIYTNLVWNSTFGEFYRSSILHNHHLGEHFSPIVLVFVPLYLIADSPLWMLGAQGLAVGTFYLLLIPLARRILAPEVLAAPGVVPFVLGLAILGSAMNSALMFNIHPSTLAVPFIAAALIALHDRRDVLFWAMLGIVFLCKENGTLAGLGLAIYAALVLGRWRMAAAIAGVSALVAAAVFGVIMPAFREVDWHHLSRIGPFTQFWAKMEYAGLLLLCSAALPLLAWRPALAVLPCIGLNLAVAYHRQLGMNYHYDDMTAVFLLAATLHGLNVFVPWMRGRGWGRALPVLALAVLLANLAVIKRPSIVGILFHFPSAAERQLAAELRPFAAGSDQGILAYDILTPHLMNRARIEGMPSPGDISELAPMVARLRPGDIVISTPIWDPERHQFYLDRLAAWPHLVPCRETEVMTVLCVEPA